MRRAYAMVVAFALAALTALMLFATVPPAQSASEDEQKFWVDQFAGWEGIGLKCSLSPVNDLTNDLCEWATAKAQLMAVTAGIPFFAAEKPDNFFDWAFTAYEKGLGKALLLEIRVFSVTSNWPGVFIEVRAAPFYTDAIEHGASPDAPEGKPKSGELVIWSRTAIGSGTSGLISRENSD